MRRAATMAASANDRAFLVLTRSSCCVAVFSSRTSSSRKNLCFRRKPSRWSSSVSDDNADSKAGVRKVVGALVLTKSLVRRACPAGYPDTFAAGVRSNLSPDQGFRRPADRASWDLRRRACELAPGTAWADWRGPLEASVLPRLRECCVPPAPLRKSLGSSFLHHRGTPCDHSDVSSENTCVRSPASATWATPSRLSLSVGSESNQDRPSEKCLRPPLSKAHTEWEWRKSGSCTCRSAGSSHPRRRPGILGQVRGRICTPPSEWLASGASPSLAWCAPRDTNEQLIRIPKGVRLENSRPEVTDRSLRANKNVGAQ